jgi:phage repressor protein C with HTH and peptisase S24 domain
MKIDLGRLLHRRGMSQRELAERIGKTDGFISQLKNGKREASPETLEAIADALHVSLAELLTERRSVAVAGRVGAGAQVQLVDAYAKGEGLYHVVCPSDLPSRGVVAVEVSGDSMAPMIEAGDILIFSRHFIGVDEHALHRIAICETEDGRALVKQVRLGRDPGTFDLFSVNSAQHPPEYGVRLRWAAPYRRHLQKEDIERI